jgi:pimeloyl-ACP methyl ester carboxylesterase
MNLNFFNYHLHSRRASLRLTRFRVKLRVHEAYQFKPERFKTLNVPTLLLLGGDSPSFSKAAIEPVNGALPNSRIVVLPGQQHIAMDTAPDLFVREVLEFLAKPA